MLEEKVTRCILCDSVDIRPDDAENGTYKCVKCGLVFHNPRPSLEAITDFYSKTDKTNSWMGRGEAEAAWDELAKRRLNYVKKYKTKGRLLDIGCGTGRFLNIASQDFEIYGTEISRNAVRLANEIYGIKSLFLGNFDELNMEKEFYDVVTLWHVLEHLPYPGRTLIKIKEILNSDGILLIAVPNDDGLWFTRRLKNCIFNLIGREPDTSNKIAYRLSMEEKSEIHLSHFNTSTLVNYLSSIGFHVIDQGMDEHYVAIGWALFKQRLRYQVCSLFNFLFRTNLYDTILIVASRI